MDAGCGSAVRNTLAFYEFGCRDLTALDIGDEWKDTALKNLNNYEIDSGFVNLVAGNADNLPYYDENEFAKLFYGNGYIDCITQKIR
ncbi:MAG: hypothetical protein PWP52_2304 [Bacteroidales bacterium]|nr:hypothetical protein [Bacteroidales bacterium]